MAWAKTENGYVYQCTNYSDLEVFKPTDDSSTFQLKFDNWWVSKDSLNELINILTELKVEVYGE
jgi:hypothetical protein